MPRVIAGAARGRRIEAPPGAGTRPTSDRAREGIFSSLASALGGWEDVTVLDLYAGSGAFGIEALSRGAAAATLVEAAAPAVATITRNVTATGVAGATVVRAKVETFVAGDPPGDAPYAVVFADPPYDVPNDVIEDVLRALARPGWLAPDAVVVVERSKRTAAFAWPDGYEPARDRAYGEAMLWYGRAT